MLYFIKKNYFCLILIFINSCSLFTPTPSKLDISKRLDMFPKEKLPLKESLSLYWNEYQVPFIDAKNDDDCAFMLGMVHSHLRLAQMEIYRKISQGRISELAGPFTRNIDHAIRIINFTNATDEIIEKLPSYTKDWLENYIYGINFYINNMKELPHEFKILKLKKEPWTLFDLITMSRFLSSDVNWFVWFKYLASEDFNSRDTLWDLQFKISKASIPSFDPKDNLSKLISLINSFTKTGSNSIVIGSKKTNTSLIANDPHLGLNLPNIWVLIGFKSKTFNVNGFSIPGIPFVLLGRNSDIAWGGTNMRALSTDFYDLNNLENIKIKTRTESIKSRSWGTKEYQIRETDYGPIITDASFFKNSKKTIAMNWVGHYYSDELSAFYKLNKAKNFKDFYEAYSSYGVSAQNFLYADTLGNIGQILAYKKPIRELNNKPFLEPGKNSWQGFISKHPYSYNPSKAFIASANNKPYESDDTLAYFYSDNNRIERLNYLLENKDYLTKSDLIIIQNDVYSINSLKIKNLIIKKLEAFKITFKISKLWDNFIAFDGHYKKESKTALAFEILLYYLSKEYFNSIYNKDLSNNIIKQNPSWKDIFLDNLENNINDKELFKFLNKIYYKAQKDYSKYENWGSIHKVRLAHIFSNIPLLGSKYIYKELEVDGTSDTVYKTAHEFSTNSHYAYYGTNSRHISDLSNINENYYVLLGGQDGWLNSDNFIDQEALFYEFDYIKFPLDIKSIDNSFKIKWIF